MMMQTMDESWNNYDMQWSDFSDQCYSDYSWWHPSMDPAMCSYGQGGEFEGCFEDWSGYDGIEEWGRRGPKFPPPDAPAPEVVEGMAMQLQQAALESQALMFRQALPFDLDTDSSMLASQKATRPKGILLPPGLEGAGASQQALDSPVSIDVSRPKPLGLASMMELASELKEPTHKSHDTPATTAPATPASSLSEFEAVSTPVTPGTLPTSGAAPGSDRVAPDMDNSTDSGYSLFGSSPWQALQLGTSSQTRQKAEDKDIGAPVKITSTLFPAPIGTAPAKVKLDELLSGEDPTKADKGSPTAGPPGLLMPGNLLPGPPPGLSFDDPVMAFKLSKRPPGLELATVTENPEESLLSGTHAGSGLTTPTGALLEDKSLESVVVEESEVNGVACTRAVWRIVQLRSRLKTSLGKPVVSPPFAVSGLGDLRLMVTPDAKGTLEGMRGKSKQSHFAKMLSQGPLECTLKVKVPCTSTPVVKFYLTVGPNCRQGPFTCDFAQHTVHGCNDFDCDWLKQVDEEGCLGVGLEIVEICADGQNQ